MVPMEQLSEPGLEVLIPIGLFLLQGHFLASGWVYNDAKRHATHSPKLWGALAALFPGVGVASYVLFSRDDRPITTHSTHSESS